MPLDLPPMMRAARAEPGGSVLDRACEGAAERRFGAGTLVYRSDGRRIGTALVLEPDVAIDEAAPMLLVGQVAATSSLAALCPPESEVGAVWGGGLTLNGATCGMVRARRPATRGGALPWLVVEVSLTLAMRGEPGHSPASTGVEDEIGAFPIEPWLGTLARHWKLAIHRWEREGLRPLGAEWTARMVPDPRSGASVLALDEKGDAIAREDGATVVRTVLDLWEVQE